MNKRALAFDAAIGILLTLVVLGAHTLKLPLAYPLIEGWELKSFDLRSRLRQNLIADSEVAIIAIDEESLSRLGVWPWPRGRIAEMVELVAKAKPKVIGLHFPLSEPESATALDQLKSLQARYEELTTARKIHDRSGAFALEISSAAALLDGDGRLAAALAAAGDVVLPASIERGQAPPERAEALSAVLSSAAVPGSVEDAGPTPEASRLQPPIAALAEHAAGIGYVTYLPDFDGVVRRQPPLVAFGGKVFPSFAFRLATAYLGHPPVIPVHGAGGMLLSINGPQGSFPYFSFHEVLSGKVSADLFKDKVVIIGVSAGPAATLYATPISRGLPAVELDANAVENLLHQRFLLRPRWTSTAEVGLILAAALFLVLAAPRLSPRLAALATALFAVAVLAAGSVVFGLGVWLKTLYPALLLVAGYVALMARRLFAPTKAAPVQAAEQAKVQSAAEAGAAGKAGQEAAPVAVAGKRTLGRYVIEKELGRGGMGVVYLGRDPRVNRFVAIKTIELEGGEDAAAVKEGRERFFREAESAGTLNHPNIVRIYDAGEEKGVAYIAMELLEGEDLLRFARKGALLPPPVAMEYVALVADALDYAHQQGIVHRDIKPANIMRLRDGTVRVADFGIAHVTTASKTGSGKVIGTPSYMSPEQVAGRKVDGRSDLFSLGIALFELLTEAVQGRRGRPRHSALPDRQRSGARAVDDQPGHAAVRVADPAQGPQEEAGGTVPARRRIRESVARLRREAGRRRRARRAGHADARGATPAAGGAAS
ncbi:MAG: serine/threonine-protein kinase [Elusimicrobia bacterium]|nr:serine/threonine-protein kinase [Elusimicrobiota bacterium]